MNIACEPGGIAADGAAVIDHGALCRTNKSKRQDHGAEPLGKAKFIASVTHAVRNTMYGFSNEAPLTKMRLRDVKSQRIYALLLPPNKTRSIRRKPDRRFTIVLNFNRWDLVLL